MPPPSADLPGKNRDARVPLIVLPSDSGTSADPHAETVTYVHAEVEFSVAAFAVKPTGAEPPPARPRTLGRYEIVSEIGHGSFGSVHVARDPVLDRQVAIKVPRRLASKEEAQDFLREARKLAQLKHPGIVAVHDVGEQDGLCFIVTELLEGRSLSQFMSERPLTWQEAVPLVALIADALAHAHAQSMIHRDIKPANIFITRDGRPVLLDFGLALTDADTGAALDMIAGTPSYMSPEQAIGEAHRVDGRTDIYSLGTVLYHLLCQRLPFRSSDFAELVRKITQDDPQPPRQLISELPPELEEVCLRAMAKKQSQRFTTAGDFAAALRAVLNRAAPGQFAPSPSVPLVEVEATRAEEKPGSSSLHKMSSASSLSRRLRDAERRQLTLVLFNFEAQPATAGGSLDAENQHELAQAFESWVRESAAAFGGRTLTPSGQAVTACFGFPVAYEDSAARAVRTALQVLHGTAEWNQRIAQPLGGTVTTWAVVHTGEVVAEEKGDLQESSIALAGDANNVLARLDTQVAPGHITITAATQRLIAGYFELESAGTQRLRGVAQPIELFHVHKAVASRSRVELVDPGNLTPLIGRDTELSVLRDRWDYAIDGSGQIVLLIGDAGLGKSRLIRELREHVLASHQPDAPARGSSQAVLSSQTPSLARRASDVDDAPAVIEFRCSQYHQNTGFFPAIEFLSRLFEFEHLPNASDRQDRLSRSLQELKLGTPENVSLFAALLSVPTGDRFPPLSLSPQKLKERTDELLRQWLHRLSEQRPVLFIVEDLHWVDPSMLELLGRHVEQFQRGRALSVFTFRPEFQTPWRSFPHQTQIALNRLSKRQIGEMMRRRTGRREIPEAIINQLAERTDGVPLFIEEFTGLIQESGVLDRTFDPSESVMQDVIPATLQDLLIARLDRMASNPEVVQLAATIGREFSYALLAAVCELPESELLEELNKLVLAEILFRQGEVHDAKYIFKHALIQDSAYQSMLKKHRQQFHQRIADVLETRFPEVAARQPDLLAQHFTEASAIDKAVQYWLKAGQRSQEQSANVEAIQQFERGMALVMSLPPSPQRDMLELGFKLPLSGVLMAVQGYAAPQVEPVQNRCIEICRQLGDGAPLFPILIANWEWLFIRGRYKTCYERCREVITLADAAQGPGMKCEAHWTHVCTSFYAGDFPAARSHAEIGWQNYHREASIEYAKITQQNSGPLNLAHLGMALWQMGYADHGFARLREALELARDLKHVFTQAVIEWKLGQTYEFAQLPEQAIEQGKHCCRIADEQGFAFWSAAGIGCQGIGLKQLGRFDEAIEALQDAIAKLHATGANILFPKCKGHLADALWQAGRRDEAFQKLDEAFAGQSSGERYMEAELLRWRGEFAFDQGRLDDAETAFRESLAVAARQHAKMYELRTTLRLCRLWQQRGQVAEARQQLESLCGWFTEGFDTPDLRAAKELLATFSTYTSSGF